MVYIQGRYSLLMKIKHLKVSLKMYNFQAAALLMYNKIGVTQRQH